MGCVVAKVAVSKAVYAIDKPYDYLVPAALEDRLRPGMRVLVPFGAGNRGSDGIVLALAQQETGGGLKAITAALEKEGYRVLRAYDGMEALDKRFSEGNLPMVLDIHRPNLCADFKE